MNEMNIEITQLEPMRVMCVRAFGESPELSAQEKLIAWARRMGLLGNAPTPRFFGFNNPDPQPDNPNYGYELWMTVSESVEPEAGFDAKDFTGGLYAVLDCENVWKIPETWQALMAWLESSPYALADHQWLEEHVKFIDLPVEEYQMRLYLPVAEK